DIIGERLIPFLLMVVGFFPISISLVIALESFVGEKERRSIEPLLSSPLEDWHLYLGKLLAVMVPPLIASYLGIVVYLIGVYRQVGWTPEPVLLVQILLLTFVQALVMVSGAVVISTQATSVRAANLLASFIIIPMAFVIQGESMVMFWAQYQVLWWVIFAMVILAWLMVRMGVAHFNREEMLGQELDTLDLRGGWRKFYAAFKGQAHSPGSWYRLEVFGTLRRMLIPLGAMTLIIAASVWIGVVQAEHFALPPDLIDLDNLEIESFSRLGDISLLNSRGVFIIWFHNARVMILALILGIISFGVFGILALMFPMMLVGYFMATVSGAGVSAGTFLIGFILPHGVFEIPAIILVGAAILYMGASLISQKKGETIGEAWLHSLADWAKITIGLVLPILAIAAFLEVFVTPRVAVWLLG
ncbi:MAG: stage II sporulation protein M, partial [Anaerolineales bacterium]